MRELHDPAAARRRSGTSASTLASTSASMASTSTSTFTCPRRPCPRRQRSHGARIDRGKKKEERVLGTQLQIKRKCGIYNGTTTKSPSPHQPAIPRPTPRAGRTSSNIRRNPLEVRPRPTSPRVNWRPDKDIAEEHHPPADVLPQPVKHQKGRKPTRGRIGQTSHVS